MTKTPDQNELWILLHESDSTDDRFAIARNLTPDPDSNGDDGRIYEADILYNTVPSLEAPHHTKFVREEDLYAPLPEHDEWDQQYEDCLDYILGHLTPRETADLLNGEPSFMTNGERGYEAARFFILDGIDDSITEWSVSQGHGPSRYAQAVKNRVTDLPEWLTRTVLNSELQRWEGGVLDPEQAAYLVEIHLLKEDILDEDHSETIKTLVREYDLDYDEYKDIA